MSNVLSGLAAGVIGAALGSPFFLVKTRLQSFSPVNPVGFQHQYRSTWDGLVQIYRREGLLNGLFSGMNAAMLRTGVGSAVQLATYDKCKELLTRHISIYNNLAIAFGASLTSGFFVCIAMNPFDVIMTRLYNSGHHLYAGPIDCMVRTVQTEGFMALYKGFGAHYLRIGPHTVLTFVFLEALRSSFR